VREKDCWISGVERSMQSRKEVLVDTGAPCWCFCIFSILIIIFFLGVSSFAIFVHRNRYLCASVGSRTNDVVSMNSLLAFKGFFFFFLMSFTSERDLPSKVKEMLERRTKIIF
jgi:hypothetical protein